MSTVGKIIVFPLWLAWKIFAITLKVAATIILLLLGPPGWAFLAGFWATSTISKNNQVNRQILAELQKQNDK